jgi:ectoine hydroxylase-related dioxygenase (phytanoyl-CoA dioxygenase family)
MDIGDWSATRDLNEVYREIRALGLETNLAELEAFGFTVIEGALDDGQVEAMRAVILALAEERLGRRLDLDHETEPTNDGGGSDVALIPFLLYKDPIFKQAVLNPKSLALITYLLGRHCILSSLTCHLKGPGGRGLGLHSDTANGVPDPFTPYSIVANCNFALTDYTEAGGCLAMVPGSHRHHRQTTRWEAGLVGEGRNRHVIPIEVPAGSAIVWHGNTWHGSFPRTVPGLRMNLSAYYCREFLQPQEDYRRTVPEGYLAPTGEDRLARLLGADLAYGWTDEGPLRLYARQRASTGRTWQS